MPGKVRSPFGSALRRYRIQRGLSQAALADLIAIRVRDNPALSSLGTVSERAISKLEAKTADASLFVTPRPTTIRILATALDIPPGSEEERAFLATAEEMRGRARVPAAHPLTITRPLFVTNGREDQFHCLQDAWNMAKAGSPQFVLLAGDGGYGKTHMIRELCMEIQDEDETVRVAWGECTSGASSVSPYLPMLQAMNLLLGLVDRKDDPAIRSERNRGQSAEAIETLLSTAPALIGTMVDEPALLDRIDSLPGNLHLRDQVQRVLGVRNATDASGRLEQAVQCIAALAASTPIILVLEDLHWAGEQMMALLLHLQRQLWRRHDVPLLVIGSYRPGDLPLVAPVSRHPLEPVINEIGRQVDNVVVDLATSVGTDRGRAFIDGLLEQLSIVTGEEDGLAEFLFVQTEGNPLFATEMIALFRETGGLAQDADHLWHFHPSSQEGETPGKIRAVVAERIERLPPHLRRILEAAAIHGAYVGIDLIAGVEDISAGEMQDAIETHLVKRYRLLLPHSTTLIAGHRLHVYQFKHAFFRDYLYNALSPRERERLHARTAENALSVLGDHPHAGSGEIAFHFEKAHRYKNAAASAYAAGGYALRQLDYDFAAHWFDLAETYARHVDDHWHILGAQNGRVATMRGHGELDAGIQLAASVAASARDHGFQDLEAESEYLQGQLYYDKGGLNAAVTHLERATTVNRDLDHHAELSGTEGMLSHAYYRLGAYDDALVHAHRAYESARGLGDSSHAAEALLAAANCEVDLGMYQTAIATYIQADEIYARAGEVRGEILTALNTGLCHIQLGEWVTAAAVLRKARDTTEVLRTPRLETSACHYLSLAMEGLGDFELARQEIAASMALRQGFGQHGNINDNIATLLRIALTEDDLPAARHHLEQLQAWTNDCGGDGIEDPVLVYLSIARAHVEMGNPEAARQAIEDGYELIMKRAKRIGDDEARRSYLENVPANRRLITWHDHGEDPEQ